MPDKDNSRTVFASNGDSVKIKRSLSQIGKLNKSVQTMMQQIKAYPLTRGAKQQQELKDFRDQINSVIDKETDRIVSADSGATGKDIATFLNVTFKKVAISLPVAPESADTIRSVSLSITELI